MPIVVIAVVVGWGVSAMVEAESTETSVRGPHLYSFIIWRPSQAGGCSAGGIDRGVGRAWMAWVRAPACIAAFH